MTTKDNRTGIRVLTCMVPFVFASVFVAAHSRAAAQDQNSDTPTADAGKLGEIVVTAQKRSERILDVPVSITAVTGGSLQQAGAVDYADYLNSVAGVSYAHDGGFLDKIFIRGLSDSMSSQDASTTGIYLDEAVLTESASSIGDIGTFDINRVEVLRGPQGTLFGDSSMGGTVRIITNKPDLNAFGALVSGTFSGTQHGGLNDAGDAMVNVPIIDGKLALRAVIDYSHDDGFVDNVATGQKGINDLEYRKARLLLQYNPVDQLQILLSFNYVNREQDSGPFQDLGLPRYQVSRQYPEDANYEMRLYGATVNYDFDWATLTSATNYLDKANSYARDTTEFLLPFIPAAIRSSLASNTGIGLIYDFPNKLFTQELRLASKEMGPFQWLVGAYYSLYNPDQLQYSLSTSPLTQGLNIYYYNGDLYERQLAEFGEVSYSPTSKLQLTVGLRQFDIDSSTIAYSSGLLNGGISTTNVSAVENSHVAKYRVSYKLTADNLLYAQAAQGFRPGGGIQSFSTIGVADLKQLGYATPPTQYTSDSLWDYEIGSKNSFLNGRLTLSGAVYYIDWKNIQLALNLADGEQFISNAGKATSKGFELETAAYPVAGLELHLSTAYTDATFGQTLSTINTVAGASLPNVPRWMYSMSSVYSRPLGAVSTGYVRADLNHVDSRLNDLAGLPSGVVNQPGYTLLNLRLGVQRGTWDTSLFVTNATNKVAILNTQYGGPPNYQTINTPRTIGVNVKKRF